MEIGIRQQEYGLKDFIRKIRDAESCVYAEYVHRTSSKLTVDFTLMDKR